VALMNYKPEEIASKLHPVDVLITQRHSHSEIATYRANQNAGLARSVLSLPAPCLRQSIALSLRWIGTTDRTP